MTEGASSQAAYVYPDEDDVCGYYLAITRSSLPIEVLRANLQRDTLIGGACAAPQFAAAYEGADLARQAAVLTASLVRNHPFPDANKRVAFQALFDFLAWNGWGLNATVDQYIEWGLRLAGDHDLPPLEGEEFAAMLTRHLEPLTTPDSA